MQQKWLFLVLFFLCGNNYGGEAVKVGVEEAVLPPLETFVLKPLQIRQVSVWIPVEKAGPFVFWGGCYSAGRNRKHECHWPQTSLIHTKSTDCVDALARVMATHVQKTAIPQIPLTIFNGWQWENLLSQSNEETVQYHVLPNGGSWENSWEQALTLTQGRLQGGWLCNTRTEVVCGGYDVSGYSELSIQDFSKLRIRNGYPKQKLF